jgi:hypothetical protein
MLPAVLPLNAEWRDDCQGKKDYDGEILRISTRYWGSRDYRIVGGNLTKPSAKSSLMLSYRANDELPTYDPGYINLVEQEFEAETEADRADAGDPHAGDDAAASAQGAAAQDRPGDGSAATDTARDRGSGDRTGAGDRPDYTIARMRAIKERRRWQRR